MSERALDLGEKGPLPGNTTQKLEEIAAKASKYRKNLAETRVQVKQLTELSERLSEGYKISVKMVVDLSDMLTTYVNFLDQIELLFNEMEKTTMIDAKDLTMMKGLAMTSVLQYQSQFRDSLDDILTLFQQNGMKEHVTDLTTLKANIEEMVKDSRATAFSSGGSGRTYITSTGKIRIKQPVKINTLKAKRSSNKKK